jgi:hypothetical protein
MSIKSKMMGTTLMSLLAVVYDGRCEALTIAELTRPLKSRSSAPTKCLVPASISSTLHLTIDTSGSDATEAMLQRAMIASSGVSW